VEAPSSAAEGLGGWYPAISLRFVFITKNPQAGHDPAAREGEAKQWQQQQ
jgi:hypothetical protein